MHSTWLGAMFIMSPPCVVCAVPGLLRYVLYSQSHGSQTQKTVWFTSCCSKLKVLWFDGPAQLLHVSINVYCLCVLAQINFHFQLMNSTETAAEWFSIPWSCDILLIAILGYRMQVACMLHLALPAHTVCQHFASAEHSTRRINQSWLHPMPNGSSWCSAPWLLSETWDLPNLLLWWWT